MPIRAHFLTNSGFCSSVCDINPLKAAHLFEVAVLCTSSLVVTMLPATSCAIFFPNLSLSNFSSFSRLFVAPGLLFILLCRIFTSPTTFSTFPVSGKASASDCSVVISFLEGRRRLRGFWWAFSMRLTKEECLMSLLSAFVLMKPSSIIAPSR